MSIILWLQQHSNEFFDMLFQLFTFFGEKFFAVPVLAYFYWCHNKETGRWFLYSTLFSISANGAVKDAVRAKRPIGEPGVRSLRVSTATGYSFPSGHTQTAATLATLFCAWIKKRLLYMFACLLVLLVSISRLYLGVHYPRDVIGGLILGIVSVLVASVLYKKIKNKNLLFFFTALASTLTLFYASSPDTFKGCGLFWGFFFANLFEEKFARFTTEGLTGTKKFIRFSVGLLLLSVVYLPLTLLKPMLLSNLPETAALMYDFSKYAVVAFVGLGIYPLCIVKFKRL